MTLEIKKNDVASERATMGTRKLENYNEQCFVGNIIIIKQPRQVTGSYGYRHVIVA